MLLQVVTGTTRQGRFSERVAAWVVDRLHRHGGFDVEAVDLRDHPLPFFDAEPPRPDRRRLRGRGGGAFRRHGRRAPTAT